MATLNRSLEYYGKSTFEIFLGEMLIFTILDGKIYGMKTTIDQAGRIVVPKAIREAVGLAPGTPLEIRIVGSHIELELAPLQVQLKRRGKLLVAIPRQDLSALTVEEVEATREALSRERGEDESKK